jgi:hypothetical protein
VSQQLFALNFKQGQRILNQQPPVPARAAEALDAFNAALALQPNDPQATDRGAAAGQLYARARRLQR